MVLPTWAQVVVDVVNAGMILGGRYRLDERIAGGGMGDVWKGTDQVLGRTVAVKILLPALLDDAGFVERFRGEARTMATINHPGVVDVYDYGSDSAVGAYLVMEYVQGDPLSRTLTRVGRLTPARTMALVAQAADALQAAHDKGIVHRDVKPGNLLVRPDGSLVLTDFGIARSEMVGQLTAVGSVLGTASYIAPEQAAGGVATPLSDVYALGVVAYQCVSGRRPFEGENPLEIALKHVRDQPPPLPPDIPPAVRQIVERAMAKEPAARFPTAAALGQVARRASAGLAGGPAGYGPSGAPVSVPPVPSQTSPGPMGGAMPGIPTSPVGPRPPAVPGGTRVMSSYPTGPTSPVGGPTAPGMYNRGAAAIPPPAPPRRPDGGYFTAAPAGPPANSGRRSNRTGLIVGGVLVGLAALVLLAVGGWALAGANHQTADTNNTTGVTGMPASPQGGGAPPTMDTPTPASMVDIQCGALVGERVEQAKADLRQLGFTRVRTLNQDGGVKNIVARVAPCPSATPGSQITLYVYDGDMRNGPGGTSPSPTCVTMGGSMDCTSPSAGTGGSPQPSSTMHAHF